MPTSEDWGAVQMLLILGAIALFMGPWSAVDLFLTAVFLLIFTVILENL